MPLNKHNLNAKMINFHTLSFYANKTIFVALCNTIIKTPKSSLRNLQGTNENRMHMFNA